MTKFFRKNRKAKYNAILAAALFCLNVLAFYAINASAQTEKNKTTTQNPIAAFLKTQETLADIFTAAVFTIDIFAILFMLYLGIKSILKLLKTQLSSKK